MGSSTRRYTWAFWSASAFTGAAIFAVVLLASNLGAHYYAGMLPCAVLVVICYSLRRRQKFFRCRDRLVAKWGRPDDRHRSAYDLTRSWSDYRDGESPAGAVDDQTWSDLEMDRVFAFMDRTLTDIGQARLRMILRCPMIPRELLDERKRVVALLQKDERLRTELQARLLWFGSRECGALTTLLWGPLPPPSRLRLVYSALACLSLAAVVGCFWYGWPVLFAFLGLCVLNYDITNKIRKRGHFDFGTLRAVRQLVRFGRHLGRFSCPELDEHIRAVREAADRSRRVSRKAFWLSPARTVTGQLLDFLYEYVSLALLVEVQVFYSILSDLKRHRGDLRTLYVRIGDLDALQAVASFRAGLPYCAEPELDDQGLHLDVRDCAYPVLQNPVANSVTVENGGLFITGSNMAGKSTFLRSIGVNALLAQTIATAYANAYRASRFEIVSSMRHTDDTEAGKSYYLAEAERLLHVLNVAASKTPSLIILDEILRGTNSTERFAASLEILRYLRRQSAIPIVASHDVVLAEELSGTYDMYHFTDRCEDDGLHFDYGLKPGLSKVHNALRLLAFLGYPPEVVDPAKAWAENAT
ncbi:MAG: hypothetical protein JXQ73_07205 [Phycisphaerae bacterium]|nr:hypothetical protein [Phycisphaerae bacterium]